VYCDVGEHYVDAEDHWSSIEKYSFCGDCMNCTSEKELLEQLSE